MGNRPRYRSNSDAPLGGLFLNSGQLRLGTEHWSPSLDLCETREAIHVRLEVPGVAREDLQVYLKDRNLWIEGVKREPEFPDEERLRFICLERGYGPFQKMIELHWVIDPRRASAVLADGVLTVTLPKIDERRGRRFEITITESAAE